jgi:hypothetical protein
VSSDARRCAGAHPTTPKGFHDDSVPTVIAFLLLFWCRSALESPSSTTLGRPLVNPGFARSDRDVVIKLQAREGGPPSGIPLGSLGAAPNWAVRPAYATLAEGCSDGPSRASMHKRTDQNWRQIAKAYSFSPWMAQVAPFLERVPGQSLCRLRPLPPFCAIRRPCRTSRSSGPSCPCRRNRSPVWRSAQVLPPAVSSTPRLADATSIGAEHVSRGNFSAGQRISAWQTRTVSRTDGSSVKGFSRSRLVE